MTADAAEDWKAIMAVQDCFQWFLMRSDREHWDTYDKHGLFLEKRTDVTRTHVEEVTHTVEVDRVAFEKEGREALGGGGWCLISCLEGHAGASAADHANYAVVCRRLIMDAKPKDMECVCIVESKKWGCRVSGIFADVGQMSPDMQNTFVERFRWLNNGWPLVHKVHRDVLADRLSKVRHSYMGELLQSCGNAIGMSPEIILGVRTKWSLASPRVQYRFAHHVVDTLEEKMILASGEAETFDPDYVERRASEVLLDWRQRLS
tara:strand:- start:506 stop:1291 length:786 start_codon:yes stop_codon:yes gene_type:complete